MGTAMGLDKRRLFALLLAARFHDLGLLAEPGGKPPDSMRCSSEKHLAAGEPGARGSHLVQKSFPDFPDALEAIWYRYERTDGKGPYGLKGMDVSLLANILGLVRLVEFLANDPGGGEGLGLDQIVDEAVSLSGSRFAPAVVQAFQASAAEVHAAVLVERGGEACAGMGDTSASARRDEVGDAPESRVEAGRSAEAERQRRGPGRRAAPTTRREDVKPAATSGVGDSQAAGTLNDLSPLVNKRLVLDRVRKGLDLRPLTETVQQVMRVTASARCSAEDLARAVMQDQAIAVRMLRVANSSKFSRGRPISSVKEAVARIGTEEVREITVAMEILDHFKGVSSERVDVRLFWEHSIACGLITSAIGRVLNGRRPEEFLLWGMLHDVGRLILLTQFPDEYAGVWEAADELSSPLEGVESGLLSLDHCEVLQEVLSHWRFPNSLVVPVVNHHQSVDSLRRLDPDYSHGAAMIALANAVAHALLLGSSGNDVIYSLDALVDMLGITPDQFREVIASIPDDVHALKFVMIADASSGDWPDLLSTVRSQLRAVVRPLWGSAKPEIDGFRVFFDRIGEPAGQDPPTLGVIRLTEGEELEDRYAEYECREREVSDSPLPVMVIVTKGRVDTEHAWLKARAHVVVKTPARVTTLVDALNKLLCAAV